MKLLMTLCLMLMACEPPIPVLAQLSSPVLTAQRRLGKELLVVLTYDDKKTPCGAVTSLRAQLDGVAMNGSPGQRVVDEKTGAVTCEFPNYTVQVGPGTTPREIVVTDDVTAVAMTLDTLEVGNANPEFPPATLRPGYVVRFTASPPPTGTTSWNVSFTPEGRAPIVWAEGSALPAAFSATVPAVTSAASGTVAATWLVNTTVTKCEGVASCNAIIQGAGSFLAVVAP